MCTLKYTDSNSYVFRQSYTRAFESFGDTAGLSFCVHYNFAWSRDLKLLLPFSGPLSLSLKIVKVDENLTKYVVKGIYDFKCKYTYTI